MDSELALKTEEFDIFLLMFSFELPRPAGTPSYPRVRVFVFQNISRIKIYRTTINYKQIKSGLCLILFVVEQLFLLEKSSGYAYVYYGEGLEFFYNIDIFTLFAPNFLEASCDICAIMCYDIRYTAPKENSTFH